MAFIWEEAYFRYSKYKYFLPTYMAKLFKQKIINQKLESFKIENFEQKLEVIQKWHKDYHNWTLKTDNEISRAPDWTRDFLRDILDYTSKPDENYTYEVEPTIAGQRPDFILGHFTSAKWYIIGELKATKISLDAPQKWHGSITPVQQAFKYKWNVRDSSFVIVSNFFETRLYYDNYLDYEMWNLDTLVNPKNDYYQLRKFIYLLTEKNLIAKRGESQTKWLISFIQTKQKEITKKFYDEYKWLRLELLRDLYLRNESVRQNIDFWIEKGQKIIDRIIFACFCEDKDLLPDNILQTVIQKSEESFTTLWLNLQWFFQSVDKWNPSLNIPEYNWWLFKWDTELNQLNVSDEILSKLLSLWRYNFEEDLSVNILGHIFEQSITDLEEIKDKVKKKQWIEDIVKVSKRKKDWVFYTPEYIVDYIVKNSVGKKIEDWEQELKEKHNLKDDINDKNYTKRAILVYTELQEKLQNITVLDPACGSGAFLVNVFDFLLSKNQEISNTLLDLKWWAKQMGFENTQSHFKSILQNNIYWVDLNEESVEITKLSLWLKTAQKGKKLANLDKNIKCGNSLIDDPAIAWDKAFDWETEFPEIFAHWGFDVIVGNPPYVFTRGNSEFNSFKEYIWDRFISIKGKINLYSVFLELSLWKLLKKEWYLGFITPETFIRTSTYQEIRNYVYQNFNIKIIDVYWNWVFDNVTAETLTMVINKKFDINNIVKFNKFSKNEIIEFIVEQKSFENIPQNRFAYNISNSDNEIFLQLRKSHIALWEIVDTRNWIATKAWKQDFISDEILNKDYKKLLEAPEISRYWINWSWNYINYDKDKLHRPRKEETFLSNKIVLIRVSPKLICYYDEWEFYTYNSVNNLVWINNNFSLKYLISLLNSSLINYYYRKLFSFDAGFTITVTKENLDILPIKNIPLSEQKPFIEKADFMLEHNKIMWEKVQKFLKRVQGTFELEKLSKKLQKFYELTFEEFLKELKKKKIVLSLKDQDEWQDYFDSYKKEVSEIKAEIDACDREIDEMVFDLYGLSEEERDVVISS